MYVASTSTQLLENVGNHIEKIKLQCLLLKILPRNPVTQDHDPGSIRQETNGLALYLDGCHFFLFEISWPVSKECFCWYHSPRQEWFVSVQESGLAARQDSRKGTF